MSAKMNVPELRFGEFSGEWEEKRLNELGNFKNGLNKSKEDFGHGFPFVNLMDVFGKDVVKNENFDLVNANEKDLTLYNLKKGDILFIRSSVKREGVGETVLIREDLPNTTYSGFLIRFREKKDNLDLLFKKYCFKTKIFRNHLLSLSTTSANTNINQESLNRLKINLPLKLEQEKIASFLSSVDSKIEQLSKKKTLLEQYKKGVMQKFFSQTLRFKNDDGSEFPEWVEKKLGEVSIITMGQSPDSSSYNTDNDGVPLIQGNADIKDRKTNPRQSTNKPTKMCEIDNLILTVRAPVGAIAKCFHNACMGRGVCSIKNNKFSNIEFLYQFLLDFEKKWISLEQGSTFTAVSSNDIKSLKINLPSLKEQTKIANFLSSLDKKIELTDKELNATKEFKKALLQKMFV